jgi:F420-non-reducing hydrogenase iron-sulfur subunit
MDDYDPKIIAFCCNWCSYAAADLAGTSRIQYPSNVRVIRVMCSGRVDSIFQERSGRDSCRGMSSKGLLLFDWK